MATVNSEVDGRSVPRLLQAADGKNSSALERLLRSPVVQVDEQDATGRTGLIIASTKGYTTIVSLLLRAGANSSVCDQNQSTCLHYAVGGNFDDIVTLLVEQSNVDIFASNLKGESPLTIAFDQRREYIMQTLLRVQMVQVMKRQPQRTNQRGCGRNGTQNQRQSPIKEYHDKLFNVAVCILRRSSEVFGDDMFIILKMFLKQILNTATHKSTSNQVTMMHSAAFIGSVEGLELLLGLPETSGTLNDFDEDGQTPLHYASMEGNLAAVKLLAAQETIRPNEVDRFDRTALQIAMERNWRYIMFALLEYPDVQADQDSLYRTKEAMVNAANALLVGGALITSVTFAAILQPPLGYNDSHINLTVAPMASFWICNGLAFFSAMITVICGTRTVVPETTMYIREEVKMIGIRLKITAIIFFISSDLLFVAYGLAGMAVVKPSDRWYTISLVIIGSIVYSCSMVLFMWFSFRKRATAKPHSRPSLKWESQELLADVFSLCVKNVYSVFRKMVHRISERQVQSL